ncbi:MAG: S-adenosyl-l-methionine hydroxide adenosyltransferase family protein [Bryobacteraceae bacterium]
MIEIKQGSERTENGGIGTVNRRIYITILSAMVCRPKFPVITLTTDFGLQDHYVASMKGVILSVNAATPIIDISHEIPPFSIVSGAYAISQAAPCFPPNTVHVVVIDPGVGTARRPVLLEAGGQVFIGPDNGVFGLVAEVHPDAKCYEISRRDLMRSQISTTFHGRDIFAPVGAAVACGKVAGSDVGPQIFDWKKLEGLSPVQIDENAWAGKILSVDRFGNVVTNFRSSEFSFVFTASFELGISGHSIVRFGNTFGEAPSGEMFAYPGSGGFIEVGINQKNAAERLNAAPGQGVTLWRAAAGLFRPAEIPPKTV